jgi:hypothetical protein
MKSMKIILSLALLIGFVACEKDEKKEIPCIPSDLNDDVIAFYSFSNGSLLDKSGNNHHLTNTSSASPSSDRNGNNHCAFEFNNLTSSNEFLTTTSTSFLNGLNEFSISLWYRAKDTTRDGGDFECLVNRGLGRSCPDREGQWSVGLYDCRKAVFGRTNSVWDENITNFDCQQEVNVRTNLWNHLVVTFKESGVDMKIYRNGVLQEHSSGDADCGSGTPVCQDIGDLFLGKGFTGELDDVIIFNKKLTQQDVNTLLSMETCCQ